MYNEKKITTNNILIESKEDFEEIYNLYHKKLFFYALKFIKEDQVVLDIIQDVFLKIWTNRDVISINTSIKSYLYKSVNNSCFDYIRKKIKDRQLQDDILLNFQEDEIAYYSENCTAIEDEKINKIIGIIDKLPDKYKDVIKLSRIEGLKNKEISKKLKIPLRSVDTLIYRGLKKIKSSLKDTKLFLTMFF